MIRSIIVINTKTSIRHPSSIPRTERRRSNTNGEHFEKKNESIIVLIVDYFSYLGIKLVDLENNSYYFAIR